MTSVWEIPARRWEESVFLWSNFWWVLIPILVMLLALAAFGWRR